MQSSRFISLINVKIYISINVVKALSETHRAQKNRNLARPGRKECKVLARS